MRQVAQRVGDAPAKQGRDEWQQALVRYTEAIQGRDLDALRGIWPALEGDGAWQIDSMAKAHSVS